MNKKVLLIIIIVSILIILGIIGIIFLIPKVNTNEPKNEIENLTQNEMKVNIIKDENVVNEIQNEVTNETIENNNVSNSEVKQPEEQKETQSTGKSTQTTNKQNNSSKPNNNKPSSSSNSGGTTIETTTPSTPPVETTKPEQNEPEQQEPTKPVVERCTNNNNHSMGVGNSNQWYSSKSQAISAYDEKVNYWSNLWETNQIDNDTYYKNCPYGYEVWDCMYCGKWTINYYYR